MQQEEAFVNALIEGNAEYINQVANDMRHLYNLITYRLIDVADKSNLLKAIIDLDVNIHPDAIKALIDNRLIPTSYLLHKVFSILSISSQEQSQLGVRFVHTVLSYISDKNPELINTYICPNEGCILTNYYKNPAFKTVEFTNIIRKILRNGYNVLLPRLEECFLVSVLKASDCQMLAILDELYGTDTIWRMLNDLNVNPYYFIFTGGDYGNKIQMAKQLSKYYRCIHGMNVGIVLRYLDDGSEEKVIHKGIGDHPLTPEMHKGYFDAEFAKNHLACSFNYNHPLIKVIKKYAQVHNSDFVWLEDTDKMIRKHIIPSIEHYKKHGCVMIKNIPHQLPETVGEICDYFDIHNARDIDFLIDWHAVKPREFNIFDLTDRIDDGLSILEVLIYSNATNVPWYTLL